MQEVHKSIDTGEILQVPIKRIIGFTKVTSLQILTHLITKYAGIEYDDTQEIDWKKKEPISGETIFEEFIEKKEWNQ